jgi:hypothetical protein
MLPRAIHADCVNTNTIFTPVMEFRPMAVGTFVLGAALFALFFGLVVACDHL